MRITNRIINILVLLLAVAGVVFAYLLFNKRETLVGGWNQMSATIGQTAKELDTNSGTKVAADLTAEKLAHQNFKDNLDNLSAALPKLQKQSKDIINQRDALAATVNELARLNEVGNIKTSDLQQIGTSEKARRNAVNSAKGIVDRNNRIFNSYIKTLSKMNIGADVGALKRDYVGLEKKASDRIDYYNNRIRSYENEINSIAAAIGTARPNYQGDYKKGVAEINNRIRATKAELSKKTHELNSEKQKTARLQNDVKYRDNQIAGHKKTIQNRDQEIVKLKKKINPDDGSIDLSNRELYSAITGKVESVNKKWGFVLINLGKKIKVTRTFPLTKKTRTEYLTLQPNDIMTIARGMTGKKPEYIAKLNITKVAEDYAIGNIMSQDGTLRPETEILPGDLVYFSQDDIKRMKPGRLDVLSVDPAYLADNK